MEFDGPLTVLQGTICSLGSRDLLNKEDSLQDVVQALRNVIESHPGDVKSKMVFFMVLNTNLSVSEKLKDDEFVGLFTNITPSIDKDYLIAYIYCLNLQPELFRVIENCPGTLGSELTVAIVKKLKDPNFHRDEFGLEHFYKLWESLFVKLCKIRVGLHPNEYFQKFVLHFNDIYNLIQRVLVTSMLIKGLECVVGFHLYYFFKSLLSCIKFYKNPVVSDDPLYKLSIEDSHEKSSTSEISLKVSIDVIFERVVNILEDITVDLWMTFSECYFDSDSENSVQLLIGDVVHNILEEIKAWDVPADVLNCLSSLAINKLDIAGLDEIISNVRNGEKRWFTALIKHRDVTEEESIKCLTEHLNLASSDDLNEILNMSLEYISGAEQTESLDVMRDLFLTAMKRTPNYSEWLEKLFKNYRSNLLTTAHTQDDLVQTFNKISKDKNIVKGELISLCAQSPLETLKEICHLAVSGSVQTEDVTEVLKVLQHPCTTFQWEGSPCIDYVLLKCLLLEKLTDKEKHSFINLIAELEKENLLGSNFAKNLLKALKTHLENVALEKSVLCLEIVKTLLNLKLFAVDEAALLVFLSQVLEHFTWDLKNYSSTKAEGRDLVVGIVSEIKNGLDMSANGSKYHWARKEITKCCPVNQACFCDLWFSCGCSWPNASKLHFCILTLAYSRHKVLDLRSFFNEDNRPDGRHSIVLSLTLLLPVLTFREWNSLFNGLFIVLVSFNGEEDDLPDELVDMFASSLYLLTLNLNGEATYPCFEYCLRNFGQLIRMRCPSMSAHSIYRTLEKIFFVLTAIENEEEKKSCWMMLSPFLMELVDWIKKKKAVDSHKDHIIRLLSLLELKDLAEAIGKRLGQ